MARLRHKLWISIGAFSFVSSPGGTDALAQQPTHKAHKVEPGKTGAGRASATSAAGGEAYLRDGGPADTRIRFYRDIELMRGHLLVGDQLIALSLWDEALPHFLHPTEELYALMEKYIKLHHITPFRRELQALAQAVKAKRIGAYQQALKVVQLRLTSALDIARRFMTPPIRKFTLRSVIEVLRTAQSEYESSMENGRFVKPVEYQDSRGFVWQAELMIEGIASELSNIDAGTLASIRDEFSRLKSAWPDPMPPSAPKLDVGQVSSLISEIESHTSRY